MYQLDPQAYCCFDQIEIIVKNQSNNKLLFWSQVTNSKSRNIFMIGSLDPKMEMIFSIRINFANSKWENNEFLFPVFIAQPFFIDDFA